MPSASHELKGAKLLLVDDTPANLKVLRDLLEAEGYKLALASDGPLALKIARRLRPELILLDVMMPGMDGYEVCRRLKADADLAPIPIIFITAKDQAEDLVTGFNAGGLDYITKPFRNQEVLVRVETQLRLQRQSRQLEESQKALQLSNAFIREVFGRYLSDEIVKTLLDHPDNLSMGGKTQKVTILMADLRGFTAMSEGLPPESIVTVINNYLSSMTDIIMKYNGTIDEFIGDAILAVFGTPLAYDDDTPRAIACAVEMQLAIREVNATNARLGLPDVALGIGLNTGEVAVGNIGSEKRAKYGVVGRHVNLAGRIESYTVGGQIYISEYTYRDAQVDLLIDDQLIVEPKGVPEPVTIYAIRGIGEPFNLYLPLPQEEERNPLKKSAGNRLQASGGKRRQRPGGRRHYPRTRSPQRFCSRPKRHWRLSTI